MAEPLVLASTSPYRADLLTKAQIPFVAVAPKIREDDYKSLGLSPFDLVQKLSMLKAQSLREDYPNSWILGSDQAAVFENQILSKPGSAEANLRQLLKLQGKTHQLMTGAYLSAPPDLRSIYLMEVATLKMLPLSAEDIADYIERDKPWDCAGGYKFEGTGHRLFERVEAEDRLSIQGLPMEQISDWWKSL